MLHFRFRAVVVVLWSLLALGLAGCGSGGGEDDSTGSSNPPPTGGTPSSGGNPPPSNQAPTASNVNVSTSADTEVSGTLSGSDPDAGDALTFSVESDPSNGSVTALNENTGAFTYTPNAGFSGTDSFTFRVTDSSNASATATVTIDVAPPGTNSVPTARADAATTNQGESILIDVLSNDLDLVDQPVTVSVVGTADHGTVVVQADNRIEYTPSIPNSTYLGPDSFIYEVRDATGDVAMASVSVTVECPGASCNRTFEASWTLVNDADVTGYCLYHDTDSGPPYADRVCIGNVNSYDWPLDVASGTDYFAVTTTYSNGDESDYSQEVSVSSF